MSPLSANSTVNSLNFCFSWFFNSLAYHNVKVNSSTNATITQIPSENETGNHALIIFSVCSLVVFGGYHDIANRGPIFFTLISNTSAKNFPSTLAASLIRDFSGNHDKTWRFIIYFLTAFEDYYCCISNYLICV